MEKPEHEKPLITYKLPTARSPISFEQVNHFAQLCEELIAATRERGWARVFHAPEYHRFTGGAYACGFVCRDINAPRIYRKVRSLMSDREALRAATLLEIRQCIHTIIRAERDCQTDETGDLKDAVESGALAIIIQRMQNDISFRQL